MNLKKQITLLKPKVILNSKLRLLMKLSLFKLILLTNLKLKDSKNNQEQEIQPFNWISDEIRFNYFPEDS